MAELTAAITLETSSASETETLAASLAEQLRGGELIVLSGELGAGKTVFVRGLARGLHCPPGVRVTSPTYVLQHAYRGGRLTVYHMDCYRIGGGAAEFEASGLRECLDDPHGVVCLEWPERLEDFRWPGERILVQIEHTDATHRQLSFTGSGPRAQQFLQAALSSPASGVKNN